MADSTIKVHIVGDSKGVESTLDKISAKVEQLFGKKLGGIINKGFAKMPSALGMSSLGIAAVATASVVAAKKISRITDQYTLMSSRIALMNDGTQTNKQLLDKISASANRARGSYHDMADTVSKLGILAKDAFNSNDEMIFFAEQMNKQFKIGGASIQEQTAAMYQLTQAMASGRLQGDEFRSIMENAPMLAQAIADEMGVTIGELRELSSEGAITAEVIKNAMVSSAEKTNEQFAKIPMTFEDTMTLLGNTAAKAFEPVLDVLGKITTSSEFQSGIGLMTSTIQGFAAVSYVAIEGIAGAFSLVGSVVTGVAELIQIAFTGIPTVMTVATAAIAGYLTYTLALSSGFAALIAASRAYAAVQSAVAAAQKAWAAVQAAAITVQSAWVVVQYALSEALAVCIARLRGANILSLAWAATQSAVAVAQKAWTSAQIAFSMVLAVVNSRISVSKALIAAWSVVASLATAKAKIFAAAQGTLNAVMALNPIAVVIGLLAALATAFAASSIAANGFKETVYNVWSSIVHTSAWAINQVLSLINKLIKGINIVGDKLNQVFKTDFGQLKELSLIDAQDAQNFINTTSEIANTITSGMSGGVPDMGGAGGGESAGGRGGKGGTDKAVEEAKRLHEALKDEWINVFKTKSELAERWRDKELEELEKSKASNVNYEEDRQMILELYSKKREQALAEEASKVQELKSKVQSLANAYKFSLAARDSTGEASPTAKLVNSYETAIDEIRSKWAALSKEYADMTVQEQAVFIKSLDERGVAYKLDADNRISFEKNASEQILAEREKLNKALELNALTQAEREWEINEAMRTQNFESLQNLLDSEYIALSESYELKKAMLEEYQQAVMDSYFNTEEMLFQMQKQGVDSLSNSISGLLQGTMSVQDAFAKLGQTLLKTVSDYTANWIAARLKQSLFGDKLRAKEAASANAFAASRLPIMRELALQESLASWGASAVAGKSAYIAATAINIPAFANGGLIDRPTLGLIGEGKYKEAVVPFNEKTFHAIGEGVANNADGGSGGPIYINAVDSQSFIDLLRHRGGNRALRQVLHEDARDFKGGSGLW